MVTLPSRAMATDVQFGRRRGTPRSSFQECGANSRSEAEGDVTGCKVAVIPATEWQRIKGNLSQRERERREQLEARQCRQDRKLQSQNIVKHWENTIEGQRLKKLQARKLREEREEQEKVKIDEDEMEYHAKCRKEAIERAKTLLYHQTDRVKTFHGALLLSEVMRERNAQLEYKKRKQEAAKSLDQKHIHIQEEERERGIEADQKAALERAKAKYETSRFQAMQVAEKQRLREKVREEDCTEQKRIDKEVVRHEDFLKTEAETLAKKTDVQLQLRAELDECVKEQAEREARRQQQDLAEARGIQLFQQAKKRMSHLRKEKEKELFQQFQHQQQRMAGLLQSQRQQERSTEDEAITKAMEEQQAKKEKTEQEKEHLFLERTCAIQQHRIEMIAARERHEREEQKANKEMLSQKRAHDLKFHQAQREKAERAYKEATELQHFLQGQVAGRGDKMLREKKEDQEITSCNQQLMEVEQRQFGEYADTVISEARARGAPIQALVQAAKAGAGGGKGPAVTGNLQPSYKATDATAVELPNYQNKAPPTPANTQKRMGFTW